jgi:hypothetical protein
MVPHQRSLYRSLLGRSKHYQEPEVEATRPCPHCKEQVSLGATVCIHCERELVPLMTYGEFARRFGSLHAGGPPHVEPGSDE